MIFDGHDMLWAVVSTIWLVRLLPKSISGWHFKVHHQRTHHRASASLYHPVLQIPNSNFPRQHNNVPLTPHPTCTWYPPGWSTHPKWLDYDEDWTTEDSEGQEQEPCALTGLGRDHPLVHSTAWFRGSCFL